MLEQRRLDCRIYDAVVNLMPPGDSIDPDSEDEMLVAAGLTAFNDFYGEKEHHSAEGSEVAWHSCSQP